MSNSARKARKRAGEKFTREPKVATPLLERSFFVNLVPAFHGSKERGGMVPRSKKQIAKALKARGIETEEKD